MGLRLLLRHVRKVTQGTRSSIEIAELERQVSQLIAAHAAPTVTQKLAMTEREVEKLLGKRLSRSRTRPRRS